jgi:hypothetical protein
MSGTQQSIQAADLSPGAIRPTPAPSWLWATHDRLLIPARTNAAMTIVPLSIRGGPRLEEPVTGDEYALPGLEAYRVVAVSPSMSPVTEDEACWRVYEPVSGTTIIVDAPASSSSLDRALQSAMAKLLSYATELDGLIAQRLTDRAIAIARAKSDPRDRAIAPETVTDTATTTDASPIPPPPPPVIVSTTPPQSTVLPAERSEAQGAEGDFPSAPAASLLTTLAASLPDNPQPGMRFWLGDTHIEIFHDGSLGPLAPGDVLLILATAHTPEAAAARDATAHRLAPLHAQMTPQASVGIYDGAFSYCDGRLSPADGAVYPRPALDGFPETIEIAVATDAADPIATYAHETIHYLVATRLFDATDRAALDTVSTASLDAWLVAQPPGSLYTDASSHRDEAIADAFARHVTGIRRDTDRGPASPPSGGRKPVDAPTSAPLTPEMASVFVRILSGAIGNRTPQADYQRPLDPPSTLSHAALPPPGAVRGTLWRDGSTLYTEIAPKLVGAASRTSPSEMRRADIGAILAPLSNTIAPTALLHVYDALYDISGSEPVEVDGASFATRPNDGAARGFVIAVSMSCKDPIHTLGHETLHYAKRSGGLHATEYAILAAAAAPWIDRYRIVERYGSDLPHTHTEEAVAECFAEFFSEYVRSVNRNNSSGIPGRTVQHSPHQEALNRPSLRSLPDTIRNVFDRLLSGEIGRRLVGPSTEAGPALKRPAPAATTTGNPSPPPPSPETLAVNFTTSLQAASQTANPVESAYHLHSAASHARALEAIAGRVAHHNLARLTSARAAEATATAAHAKADTVLKRALSRVYADPSAAQRAITSASVKTPDLAAHRSGTDPTAFGSLRGHALFDRATRAAAKAAAAILPSLIRDVAETTAALTNATMARVVAEASVDPAIREAALFAHAALSVTSLNGAASASTTLGRRLISQLSEATPHDAATARTDPIFAAHAEDVMTRISDVNALLMAPSRGSDILLRVARASTTERTNLAAAERLSRAGDDAAAEHAMTLSVQAADIAATAAGTALTDPAIRDDTLVTDQLVALQSAAQSKVDTSIDDYEHDIDC